MYVVFHLRHWEPLDFSVTLASEPRGSTSSTAWNTYFSQWPFSLCIPLNFSFIHSKQISRQNIWLAASTTPVHQIEKSHVDKAIKIQMMYLIRRPERRNNMSLINHPNILLVYWPQDKDDRSSLVSPWPIRIGYFHFHGSIGPVTCPQSLNISPTA